jgi:cysteine desulfurase family protein (TIGR01976 family)
MDIKFVREQFPSLTQNYIFMDNAGGSQALGAISQRITEYFMNYNVQLGASYEVSARAGEVLEASTRAMAGFIGAGDPREIIVGPSTTMLLRILSLCLSRHWKAGDEVIVTNSDHEANVSCWMDLKERGIVVKIWKLNPESFEFETGNLRKLITERTKLVAMVHVSNILGTINPIAEIAGIVHEAGALFCVDGVACAPHRKPDMNALDVDFYVFSTYKLFGPHQAVMYGKFELLREMDGINHYFITRDDVPYKFQPGNFNFELCYSLQAIPGYFEKLYDHHFPAEKSETVAVKYQKAYDLIAEHEEILATRLINFLKSKKDVNIIGYQDGNRMKRVPTVSFVHESYKSHEIVEKVDPHRIGIRFGDFYAKKIIEDHGLLAKNGVVRISLVHYNTLDEVDKIVQVLDKIL